MSICVHPWFSSAFVFYLLLFFICIALSSPAAAFTDSRGAASPDVMDRGRDIRDDSYEISLVQSGLRQVDLAKFDDAGSNFKIAFLAGEKTGNTYLQGFAMLGFGKLYAEQAKYSAAAESYDRAIALFKLDTGKQQMLLVEAYVRKIDLMLTLGRPADAATALDAAYALVREDKGSPQNLDVFYESARLEFYNGNYEQARVLFMRVRTRRMKLLGVRHPDVADTCMRIGEILQEQKKFDLARDYFYEAADIYEATYGKETPATARAYAAIGNISALTGDFPAGLLFLQRAMDIQAKKLDRQHPDHAASSASLGMLYLATDYYDNALSALQHSLDADSLAFGENSLPVARDYQCLGQIHLERKVLHLAVENLTKALEIRTALLYDNHPALAETLNSLAVAWYYQGGYDKAIAFQRQALKIDLNYYDKADTDAQIADFNNLGILAAREQNYKMAIEHYIEAIKIEKLATNAYPLRLASLYHNLAEAYEATGDDASAVDDYAESLKLMRWSLGLDTESIAANYVAPLDNHPPADKYIATEGNQYVADEFFLIGNCDLRLGNEEEAEKAYKSFLRLTFPTDPRADKVIEILKQIGRWDESEPSPRNYLPLSKPEDK